jgi:CDP-glucose 4,6-dehydratase
VRQSYLDPRGTLETNAMGTLNVLEATSRLSGVLAQVIVTTDKVYRNVDKPEGYVESEPLGGVDPYSASKAMADILTQSWVASFPGVPTGIARGGNVIGGGDVSKDRLLPDLLNGFADGVGTSIRYPAAVRPWQHVLDCLNGYLVLADALVSGHGAGEWNFGPGEESFVSVKEVADRTVELWGGDASWTDDSTADHPHEANLLALDATKARQQLGWKNHLLYPESLEWTVQWQRRVAAGESARTVTAEQIASFEARLADGV